ncbi:MAG: hypothetical protein ACKO8O_22020, partial [Betaproteobacteria bacterium]
MSASRKPVAKPVEALPPAPAPAPAPVPAAPSRASEPSGVAGVPADGLFFEEAMESIKQIIETTVSVLKVMRDRPQWQQHETPTKTMVKIFFKVCTYYHCNKAMRDVVMADYDEKFTATKNLGADSIT